MTTGPIFLFGMTARVGTNYLMRLLLLHPDCERFPLQEDFLFANADPLVAYADRMKQEYRGWIPHWRLEPETAPEIEGKLDRAMGEGLLKFIASLSGNRRPVLKTPTVAGIRNFLRLCPDHRCVLLVRDGRSVAESLMHSGMVRQEGRDLAWCAESWGWAAGEIAKLRQEPGFERILVVRFEDLVLRTRDELARIVPHVGLSLARYPMWKVAELPVTGSSFVGSPEDRWEDHPKPADFHPETRHAGWDAARCASFDAIAGAGLRELGYSP
jgi:hypothetical protein